MKTSRFIIAFFLFTTTLFAQNDKDPVLMTINGTPIHRSEFVYLYNKNNADNVLDKRSLNDYLELFENFKLKVIEAEAEGMDTTKAFRDEFLGYRQQLTPPYLTDTVLRNKLERQAYNRLKKEIDVDHILIRVAPNASPADTLKAYNEIMAIRKRVTKNRIEKVVKKSLFGKKIQEKILPPENFETVAREVSQDPSVAENGGHLGYITGFMTIYPFECAAYHTPLDSVSMPVRTLYGYHLIKVNGIRPSRGEVHVAHIMIFAQKGSPDSVMAAAKHRIDSIYTLLQKGADFATLARRFSQDRGSAVNGGILPWFGTGFMVKSFEDTAFALNKGEISKPFQTIYGWHIMKMLDKRPLASFAQKRTEIDRRIQYDVRSQMIADSFSNKLKKEYNFQVDPNALAQILQLAEKFAIQDSAFKRVAQQLNAPIASYAGVQLTQQEFIKFLEAHPNDTKATIAGFINNRWGQFVSSELMSYENSQLEHKYPDFANLVREYHDGILLFDISNKEVWDKATKDTIGLKNYFNTHKNNYIWKEPHFKGMILYCKNEAVKRKAMDLLKKAPSDSVVSYIIHHLNQNTVLVRIDQGIFAKGDNPAVDKLIFHEGFFNPDSSFPIVFYKGKILKQPDSYADVKGLVTADYQNYLDAEWIKKLRKKYPIVVNQKVLATIKEN
ncbi:peptidylprolyl isomerase [Microbacter margulisiae]|uniref:Peptidyl-prolyl cis-trans isomerase SurA n=1 Tax=Microbacter margulisiae TaxID=1350067 RepID=A0A7W5DQQ9_9PORP|nr:peptidylprolyl isomerase [Microbacter margulisiae]MBB3187345.1 peptidyl-prolyl cis-trans isomerase SurA [Microbacter margulisiae]